MASASGMYSPCLVRPYHRVPGWWKMPDLVSTQTVPSDGGGVDVDGGCGELGIDGVIEGRRWRRGLGVHDGGVTVKVGGLTGSGLKMGQAAVPGGRLQCGST